VLDYSFSTARSAFAFSIPFHRLAKEPLSVIWNRTTNSTWTRSGKTWRSFVHTGTTCRLAGAWWRKNTTDRRVYEHRTANKSEIIKHLSPPVCGSGNTIICPYIMPAGEVS